MLGDCKKLNATSSGMVDQYQSLYDSFRWLVPTHFNIGQECCHRWANSSADARRIALFYEALSGSREIWTYERLAATANQLSNGLTRMGVRPGDRVALIMGQRPEALVAHIAIYSVGAVVVPFASTSTTAMLEQRLRDAEARVAIFDHTAAGLLLSKLSRYPTLKQLIGIDVQDERVLHWRNLMLRQPNTFKAVVTRASDPAILLYEPGPSAIHSKSLASTALAKTPPNFTPGVVLSHAALMGNLPTFVASHNWFAHASEVMWSPTEWYRQEGLMQALLPTLYFGQAFVATAENFAPARSLEILQRYRVTSAAMSADTLAVIEREALSTANDVTDSLRSLVTTGKNVPLNVLNWCEQKLHVLVNETFGTTQTGQVLGNSHLKWPTRQGSLGRPFPGHRVSLLDTTGVPVQLGETGEICVNRVDQHGYPDPALFKTYWRQETATNEAFTGNWYRSGIFARQDEDGYFWQIDVHTQVN